MQDSLYGPPEYEKSEDAGASRLGGKTSPRRGAKASVWIAFALLAWDAVFTGSFGLSFFVCPIWLLVSVLKNAIQRPGWGLSILRIMIPPLTLGLVLANNAVQLRIAETNAPQIVAACEKYHADNGEFPTALDQLVPQYMRSIPRAKYCVDYGEFVYFNYGKPMLIWYVVPPFNRRIYDFEKRRWNYVD
jgi:hypothetical protein